MSPRGTNVAVALVAVVLAAGGVFIGLRGLSDDGAGAPGSVPAATVPPVTVAPPAPAVVDTVPGPAVASDADDDGLLPVPNVLGVSEAVARSRLDEFDVQLSRVRTTVPDDFDEITEQTPAAASRIEAGARVDLVLSERPQPETIDVEPLPTGEFDRVEVVALEVGECGVRRLEDRVLAFDPVDCAEPHDLELIARIEIAQAPDEYDDDIVSNLVSTQCADRFEEHVGLTRSDSALISFSIRPGAEAYVDGERSAACAVRALDGTQLLGSAAGTFW